MNKKTLLAGAALSGLMFAAGLAGNAAAEEAAGSGTEAKGECHGVNACKGTGDCGGKNYGCAGNNACKGQGWKKMSKDECEEQGGTFKAD